MPLSFDVEPRRPVPFQASAAEQVRWVVRIRHAGRWTGWGWLDRWLHLSRKYGGPDSGGGGDWGDLWIIGVAIFLFFFLPYVLLILALPTVLLRIALYRLRRRKDWDVIVFRGEDDIKRNRVLVEHHPNKAAAVARAEALWQHLDANDALPEQL